MMCFKNLKYLIAIYFVLCGISKFVAQNSTQKSVIKKPTIGISLVGVSSGSVSLSKVQAERVIKLQNAEGEYLINSFIISYMLQKGLIIRQCNGDSLSDIVLQELSEVVKPKFYFDEVLLLSKNGGKRKLTGASFTLIKN